MEVDSADWQIPNTLDIAGPSGATSTATGAAAATSAGATTSGAAAVQMDVMPVAKKMPMDSVLATLGTPSTGASVLAPSTIVPSVTVSLHPLVILHLSEHWTRIRAQEGQKQQGWLSYLVGGQKE